MTAHPPLFISHSSAPDAGQDELLELIRAEFAGKLEILLDRDLLQGGNDWRHEIYTWMGLCRVAVVLFSAGVIARPDWVRQEATILAWREAMARMQAGPGRPAERSFLLLPVLLPGFPRETLTQLGLEPLFLSRLQLIEGDSATAIMDKLRPRLAEAGQLASEEAPLRRTVNAIEALLAAANITEDECLVQVAHLRDTPATAGECGHHELLARALLHADLDRIADVLGELSTELGRERVLKILDELSALWVNARAAAHLPDVAAAPPTQRAAALNGSLMATARSYVRRAYLGARRLSYKAFEVNNTFTRDAVAETRQQLRAQFQALLVGSTPAEIERQLDRFLGLTSPQPVFLLLPGPISPATLRDLQRGFPGATFLLLSPESFERRHEYADNPVHFLEPPLEPGMEDRFSDIRSDLLLSL